MEPTGTRARAKVGVVIPAFDEEETIGGVVSVLMQHPLVDEVVVVSDGSTDETATVARSLGARVIELPCNEGKGAAMQSGLRVTDADIVLFLDADLVGLRREHVEALLAPVLGGPWQMAVGVFESGRPVTDLAQAIAPFLSGQRAVHRTVLSGLGELNEAGFGVEMALTRYMRRHHHLVHEVVLRDLTHRMKEEKRGLIKGFSARMKMYWEIVKYLPKDVDKQ